MSKARSFFRRAARPIVGLVVPPLLALGCAANAPKYDRNSVPIPTPVPAQEAAQTYGVKDQVQSVELDPPVQKSALEGMLKVGGKLDPAEGEFPSLNVSALPKLSQSPLSSLSSQYGSFNIIDRLPDSFFEAELVEGEIKPPKFEPEYDNRRDIPRNTSLWVSMTCSVPSLDTAQDQTEREIGLIQAVMPGLDMPETFKDQGKKGMIWAPAAGIEIEPPAHWPLANYWSLLAGISYTAGKVENEDKAFSLIGRNRLNFDIKRETLEAEIGLTIFPLGVPSVFYNERNPKNNFKDRLNPFLQTGIAFYDSKADAHARLTHQLLGIRLFEKKEKIHETFPGAFIRAGTRYWINDKTQLFGMVGYSFGDGGKIDIDGPSFSLGIGYTPNFLNRNK